MSIIKVEHDKIIYSLNTETNTASIISNNSAKGEIMVPRSINYKSTEFIVTNISKRAFISSNIESIQFPVDSEVQIIEAEAFSNSIINNLSIPSSIIELKEEWCFGTPELTKINLSPDNPYYKIYENIFIIGKSSIDQDDFDVLVFCIRDIETVTIPRFIKIIGSCSFCECEKISTIEIPLNSELQIIEKEAFAYSSIKSFIVPPHLIKICERAFFCCEYLVNFEIPKNSELKTIEKHCFSCSPIGSLSIPSSLIELKEGWCHETADLKEIYVDPNNPIYKSYDNKFIFGKSSIEQENYDNLFFCVRDIETVKIPSFIKRIGQYAFERCVTLQKVEVEMNSQLQVIDNYAFFNSAIECLTIPSSLVELKAKWCHGIRYLMHINISPKNKRYCLFNDEMIIGKSLIDQIDYDVLVFCVRDIETITIPSFIKRITPYAFYRCKTLHEVEIPKDSQLETIDNFAFCCSSIEKFIVPSNLKVIGEKAFSYCKELKKIIIPDDSKVHTIGDSAFYMSSIKNFVIPNKLTQIEKYTFHYCSQLQRIDIQNNSELNRICDEAFASSQIQCFTFPPQIKYIGEFIFSDCTKLQIIEFNANSEIEFIESCAFKKCQQAIIMIPSKLKDNFISVYDFSTIDVI